HIIVKFAGMGEFFLSLQPHPLRKSAKGRVVEVGGHAQIGIGRCEFEVDLVVESLLEFVGKLHALNPKPERFSCPNKFKTISLCGVKGHLAFGVLCASSSLLNAN